MLLVFFHTQCYNTPNFQVKRVTAPPEKLMCLTTTHPVINRRYFYG